MQLRRPFISTIGIRSRVTLFLRSYAQAAAISMDCVRKTYFRMTKIIMVALQPQTNWRKEHELKMDRV